MDRSYIYIAKERGTRSTRNLVRQETEWPTGVCGRNRRKFLQPCVCRFWVLSPFRQTTKAQRHMLVGRNTAINKNTLCQTKRETRHRFSHKWSVVLVISWHACRVSPCTVLCQDKEIGPGGVVGGQHSSSMSLVTTPKRLSSQKQRIYQGCFFFTFCRHYAGWGGVSRHPVEGFL